MNLPADDFILLSVVNTYLRDRYADFGEFCKEEQVNGEEVVKRLKALGYEYDARQNAFK